MVQATTHASDETKTMEHRLNKVIRDYLAEANIHVGPEDTVSVNEELVTGDQMDQPIPDNSVLIVAPKINNG